MAYRVHRFNVGREAEDEILEDFLNRLEGEVISVYPDIVPKLNLLGNTAGYHDVIIIEKTKYDY